MSSTNKTTNYELSQFIETDRPAWLTDYNSDMRKIDSNLKEVSDIAGGASSSISALADRMSTAEGNITNNTNDIATLDARADALEAGAQSQAGTIAGIQTEQTAQNMGIEAATELGYNLARPYDSASTYAVGAYVLFQNTLYKCVTAVPTGEAFDPTKWLAIKATDEIAAGGYTLPIASASQLGGVKVGDGLSIDPVSGILSAGGESVVIHSYTRDTAPITIDSGTLYIYKNHFTATAQTGSAQNLQNLSISTSANVNNFNIIEIDRVIYLDMDFFIRFDSYTPSVKDLLMFHIKGTLNFAKLPIKRVSFAMTTQRNYEAPEAGSCVLTPAGGIYFNLSEFIPSSTTAVSHAEIDAHLHGAYLTSAT